MNFMARERGETKIERKMKIFAFFTAGKYVQATLTHRFYRSHFLEADHIFGTGSIFWKRGMEAEGEMGQTLPVHD